MESLKEKPIWENPQTLRLSSETVLFTSNNYMPTLTTQCQIFKAELTFTQLEQRYKQINSSCYNSPLHLPQANHESFSLKTPAAKAGHRAGQGNHWPLKPTCPRHCSGPPSPQLLFEGLQFPKRP